MPRLSSGRLALAVSCLSLVVAMGGVTYAAATIGTAQLKKNAVTSPKIKNDTVTGKDVKESSLAKVPSAAQADSATNATKVGGLSVVKVHYLSNSATPTILAQLGGLTVSAVCPGNDITLTATTTKQDSSISSNLLDLENEAIFADELEWGAFDTATTFGMTSDATEPSEDPAQITFTYSSVDGSAVTGTLWLDDNAGTGGSCHVAGTVIGG
jgi:hypothetical protein